LVLWEHNRFPPPPTQHCSACWINLFKTNQHAAVIHHRPRSSLMWQGQGPPDVDCGPPPPHRHDDKVWGSTCAWSKKSNATSAHSALTDEDDIFKDVLESRSDDKKFLIMELMLRSEWVIPFSPGWVSVFRG